MFCESGHYQCAIKIRKFSPQVECRYPNAVVLHSYAKTQTSECRREESESITTNASMTTVAPRPAPRKSISQQVASLSQFDIQANSDEEGAVSVRARVSKFRQLLAENHQEKIILMHSTPIAPRNLKSNPPFLRSGVYCNKQEESCPMQTSTFNNEDEANESSSDCDTGDSNENKQDRPKPGRLDLRQFDNITTAIGKLKVQQPRAVTPTAQSTSSKSTDKTNPNARRLNNPRQKQGRAVAPPQLPSNLMFKSSAERFNAESAAAKQGGKPSRRDEDESAIDFNQSPIASRLLKSSKNHKGRLNYEF